jgi:hypothetical protein
MLCGPSVYIHGSYQNNLLLQKSFYPLIRLKFNLNSSFINNLFLLW